MLTTEQLAEAALTVLRRFPDAELEKNLVGNLAIIQSGSYVGYIDLANGEVNAF